MDVVIIDADEGIQAYYASLLQSEFRGLKLQFFREGVRALEYIGSQPCDLVIAESVLPDIDVFALIEKLVHMKKVVVIASSETSERLIVECLRSGAIDFLSKQEIKLGIFPRILTRAFLEADRSAQIENFSASLPHRPEYFKVNEELRSFLSHERQERRRSLLLRGIVDANHDLVEGESYLVVYIFLQLQFPASTLQSMEPERAQHVRESLIRRAEEIGEKYGGHLWSRKSDGGFFGFVGDAYFQAVLSAIELHSTVNVFNFQSHNMVDRIGINIAVTSGITVYRENKGDIYSEALNLGAHMAMGNGLFNGIMISQEVMDNLTPRVRKYFFRSEKFENHPAYHFEIVA